MTEKQLLERVRAFPLLARQAVAVQVRIMAKVVERSRDTDGVLWAMPEMDRHLADQLEILEWLPQVLAVHTLDGDE